MKRNPITRNDVKQVKQFYKQKIKELEDEIKALKVIIQNSKDSNKRVDNKEVIQNHTLKREIARRFSNNVKDTEDDV